MQWKILCGKIVFMVLVFVGFVIFGLVVVQVGGNLVQFLLEDFFVEVLMFEQGEFVFLRDEF